MEQAQRAEQTSLSNDLLGIRFSAREFIETEVLP